MASKAELWATSHPRFECGDWEKDRNAHVVAMVDDRGALTLSAGAAGIMNLTGKWEATPPMAALTPEKAIALGRWLIDTFGEPETKETSCPTP